jgi:hypothetical protein
LPKRAAAQSLDQNDQRTFYFHLKILFFKKNSIKERESLNFQISFAKQLLSIGSPKKELKHSVGDFSVR